MLAFTASGFRNLKETHILPDAGINVIYGNNGHGKTNLLEGIGLFNGMRSFRGAKNGQMICRGEEFSRLEMSFNASGREQSAAMTITEQARELTLNGVKKEAASAMIGEFCTVVFSPDRMSLVSGGAVERRRFIDAAIGQIYPRYTTVLYKFNQILQQRNSLLKDIAAKPSLRETIDVWNMSLASYGAAVICKRAAFVEQLSKAAAAAYAGISDGREVLTLRYEDSFAKLLPETGINGAQEAVAESYRKQLEESLEGDIRLGFTFCGPQRDDLGIALDGGDARIYGSQGQKRSAVLALKLAEAAILADVIDERPVALLDDVMSELDAARQDYLLNRLSGWQVFITCCDPGPLRLLGQGKVFRVEDGKVESQ